MGCIVVSVYPDGVDSRISSKDTDVVWVGWWMWEMVGVIGDDRMGLLGTEKGGEGGGKWQGEEVYT